MVKIINLLEENIIEYLYDLEIGKGFLNSTQKSINHKKMMNCSL